MKRHKIFIVALATFFGVLSVASLNAGEVELNKKFDKEFNVDKSTNLLIDNRFGQVSIENWDKSSILIEVLITVENSNKERAERMLSAIDITLEQLGNEVRGITKVDERLMKSASSLFNIGSSSKEINIDYTVKMPKHIDVNLKNKYGDMFIDELTGHTEINLKYGNLKANRIIYGSNDPLSMLTLGYGNASIDEVDWMRFDIKYANVDVVKGKALVVLSKYSKVSVSKVSSLVVDSKYDTYTIGTIANIVGESGYTTYRINKLGKKLDIKSRYGDVRIEEVADMFESISFEGKYASIYAPIGSSVSYKIDGEASYGGLKYNSPARVNRVERTNSLSVNGTVGEKQSPKASVKVNVKYGSAQLR